MDAILVGKTDRFFAALRLHLRQACFVAVCALLPAIADAGTIVTGSDAGIASTLRVFDSSSSTPLVTFSPYGGYTGGVRVAAGDVNGDGVADLISGSGLGASHVKVFDGVTNAELASFLAFPGFTGGVFVAAGDVSGDGKADIIVGTDAGTISHVKVFDAVTLAEIRSFFAYGPSFSGGVRVAAGDVNGDGTADIITGSGVGASHVKVFDGRTGAELRSFFAFPGFNGGVFVAAGDINGDGKDDLFVGVDAGAGPHVKVFDAVNVGELRSFFAYGATFTGGVRVAAADINGDGTADIITGTGAGAMPHVKVFDGRTGADLQSFFAFQGFTGGVYVAGAAFEPIDSTLDAAIASNFHQGVNLLENAQRKLESGNVRAACNMIAAFTHQVSAQAGKSLTDIEAGRLLTLAARDQAALGCR